MMLLLFLFWVLLSYQRGRNRHEHLRKEQAHAQHDCTPAPTAGCHRPAVPICTTRITVSADPNNLYKTANNNLLVQLHSAIDPC